MQVSESEDVPWRFIDEAWTVEVMAMPLCYPLKVGASVGGKVIGQTIMIRGGGAVLVPDGMPFACFWKITKAKRSVKWPLKEGGKKRVRQVLEKRLE